MSDETNAKDAQDAQVPNDTKAPNDVTPSPERLLSEPFLIDTVHLKLLSMLDMSEYMKVVEEGIRRAYGRYCKDKYVTNTVGKIMSGEMQCWMAFAPGDDRPRIVGMIITDIRHMDMFNGRALYIDIVSLADGIRLSEGAYRSCFASLRNHAEEHECDMVFAETINLDLAAVAGKLGFTCVAAILKMDL